MRIIFLHLSDIHTRHGRKNAALSRAREVAAAAASVAADARFCFVVISGDIAFAGKTEEYQLVESFFCELRDNLRGRLSDCQIEFVAVPGNHDCDFSQPNKAREIVLGAVASGSFDASVFAQGTAVQHNFEQFICSWTQKPPQSETEKLFRKFEFVMGDDSRVVFQLVNSAWMSKKEEGQGSLLFPTELLSQDMPASDKLPAPSLVITVFHHPYNWLESSNAREFRRSVERTSDIVLTGHEHDPDAYSKSSRQGGYTEFIEGGVLQSADSPERSSFNVLAVDLTEGKQLVNPFVWNTALGRYESEGAGEWAPFVRNRQRLASEYALKPNFDAALSDIGVKFTHPNKDTVTIEDLFVEPDLRRLNLPGEEVCSPEMLHTPVSALLSEHPRILITGPEKSGKTILAKRIYRDLTKAGLIPLYLTDIKPKDCHFDTVGKLLEQAFTEQYAAPDLVAFRQLERAKKAVIVDDFHAIPVGAPARESLVRALEGLTAVLVLIGDDQVRFDETMLRRTETESVLKHFAIFEILPFGHQLRSRLVEKWCCLGSPLSANPDVLRQHIINKDNFICSLLNSLFIPSQPFFILTLMQQLEAGTRVDTSSGSYGFLFEALLTAALTRSSKLVQPDLETLYTYLAELAYYFYTARASLLSTESALAWHNRHCEAYSLRLDFDDVVSILNNASVLLVSDGSVAFRYSYIYFYFVARYFRDHINEETIRADIRGMVERVYNTEAANVIMVLCYLSKDPFILSAMLEASRRLYAKWPEIDLDANTKFLDGLVVNIPQLRLDATDTEENRRKLLARRDEDAALQKETDKEDHQNDDDESLQAILEINAAFKTIQILGQILRNFAGSLKGETKLEIAKETYSLGLRVLRLLFRTVETHLDEAMSFLTEILSNRHPKKRLDEMARDVSPLLFSIMEGFAFGVIKHVSDAVGLDRLTPTLSELVKSSDTVSYRFITISEQLDFSGEFPKAAVFDLQKAVRKNHFATQILRRLVWYYFYLYPAGYQLRESVCRKLGIQLRSSKADKSPAKWTKGRRRPTH